MKLEHRKILSPSQNYEEASKLIQQYNRLKYLLKFEKKRVQNGHKYFWKIKKKQCCIRSQFVEMNEMLNNGIK